MSGLGRVICFLGVCFGPLLMYGQVASHVSGLESNPKYMLLLEKEKQLHHVEDSIVKVISDTRKLFSSGSSDRERLSAEILRLENELFDVRDSIGMVVNEIGTIEQEMVVNNLGGGQPAQTDSAGEKTGTDKPQVTNLVYNTYFKDNLAPADYEALCKAQQMEQVPPTLLKTYLSNYDQMKQLAAEYTVTSNKDTAETAYVKLQTIKDLNARIADSLSGVWEYIYDNKTYAYNYLLDKLNKQAMLSDFDSRYKETVQQIAAARDHVASEAVFGYPLCKKLVLSYEVAIADMLGYTQARDSVSKVLAQADKISYDLPKIEPEERNFIEYADIVTSVPSKYNTQNPIPENEIHRKGTVYKIQIGVFSRKQPVSIFRGVSPLGYDALEDGRFRYSAGAFRELSEAEAARERMKKLGFRQPEIVVWRDGVFEQLSNDSPGSSSAGKEAPLVFYRVEITGGGETLSGDVRKILDEAAPGKELTRAAGPDDTYIFTVGSFDRKETAEELARLLTSVDGISTNVLELGN